MERAAEGRIGLWDGVPRGDSRGNGIRNSYVLRTIPVATPGKTFRDLQFARPGWGGQGGFLRGPGAEGFGCNPERGRSGVAGFLVSRPFDGAQRGPDIGREERAGPFPGPPRLSGPEPNFQRFCPFDNPRAWNLNSGGARVVSINPGGPGKTPV